MKIVFLDRDGVINKYPGDRKYVTSVKGFRFLPRVKKALSRLSDNGCRLFVVSNQAGVSKGIYSRRALDEITNRMLAELKKYHTGIDRVYYCLHRDVDQCSCRKPKTGMIKNAVKEYSITKKELKNAFFVGDTIRDIQTGRSAGCKTILVFSGKEKPANNKSWEIIPDHTAKDLYQAADIILEKKK